MPAAHRRDQSRMLLLGGVAVGILLLVLYFSPSDEEHWEESSSSIRSRDRSAAHLMLVLQWPESFCASEKRGCASPISATTGGWTVHGLWPTARHKQNCRADFHAPLLGHALRSKLLSVWPSHLRHNGHEQFWKHEYHKHGSCLFDSMGDYFSRALDLHARHSVGDIIPPSLESRSLESIQHIFRQSLGVEVMLMCQSNWIPRRSQAGWFSGGSRNTEQLLVEIGLCFTEQGVLTDCPARGRVRRCKRGQHILMPPINTFTDPQAQGWL
jgi:ribonuclease I